MLKAIFLLNRLPAFYKLCFILLLPPSVGLSQHESDLYHKGHQAFAAKNYEEARNLWLPLAQAGDMRAQISMGSLYDRGYGVEQNHTKAAVWFRRAAVQGLPAAQYNLGNAYQNGRGVPLDETQAAHWWKQAAEQGFAAAQFNLATQYYYGRGITKDEDEALRWYRQAAANGHEQAQLLISSKRIDRTEKTQDEDAGVIEPKSQQIAGLLNKQWILKQNPQHYTLQLSAMSDLQRLNQYIDNHQIKGRLAFYPYNRGEQTLFVLLYGSFPDKDTAKKAINQLPPKVRTGPPWARPFLDIHQLIDP